MEFITTPFEGLFLVQPKVFQDSRGYFFESYSQRFFDNAGLPGNWVQDNQSSSSYGVIRGLHYQLNPSAQTKLVRVLFGKILDVVVDIRKGSPTYQQAYSVELSDENKTQILVPRGFAHGFSVLSERAVVLYKCDAYYDKSTEAGIIYNDPALAVDWKIPAGREIVSDKDLLLPTLDQSTTNFEFKG
ncbi:MAG: dTDP-4-dehydrorhamnose 3,5-epimerase [Chitinophagaceae bacterium]|nr:dTDP-4-dehydrorhamnose 3,5-epimerase [Chitinophagaceae bacterium]